MVQVSRRRILQGSAVAVAGTLTPVGAAGVALAAKPPVNLLSRARFAGLVGSAFTLSSGGQSWTARLAEVGDLLGAPAGDDARFSLTFTTAVSGPAQGVHVFSRAGFTATSLFVIPDGSRRSYVGVVNRL